ncbi:MAG: UDP-N-acetylmuramoyl-L-alanine--D-glutamate ligase [Acidimicrobiia bacterium]|nr:UDP-N-acetylmuramoyl-L-alanine--D-glutamate ligase [Acidimicrobiia bacterium]
MSGRVLVLGLGSSGSAAAGHLHRAGSEVVVVDDAADDAVMRRAETLIGGGLEVLTGVHLAGGGTPDAVARLLEDVELVVASPGIAPAHPLIVGARERHITIWSEIELAYRSCRAPIVAVTGTNGKTTVASLIGETLAAAGTPSVVCGNIGTPMISVVDSIPTDGVAVVEVSSFQLTLTEAFHARVGVFLNLAPDHLDWHASVGEYAQAKSRIWRNQTEDDLSLAGADDEMTASALRQATGRHALFSARHLPETGAGVRDSTLVVRGVGPYEAETEIVRLADLPGSGAIDLANAAAVAAAVCDLGVVPGVVADALCAARRPPHRRQIVGRRRAVTYVDDSKATNPHAAIAAIDSYPTVVLIAGGRNKGLDLGAFAATADRVRGLVAIGECAPEVVAAFESTGVPAVTAADMESAVRQAAGMARAGDTVLLSPGCASFDWYRDYAERGRAFTRACKRLGVREDG